MSCILSPSQTYSDALREASGHNHSQSGTAAGLDYAAGMTFGMQQTLPTEKSPAPNTAPTACHAGKVRHRKIDPDTIQ